MFSLVRFPVISRSIAYQRVRVVSCACGFRGMTHTGLGCLDRLITSTSYLPKKGATVDRLDCLVVVSAAICSWFRTRSARAGENFFQRRCQIRRPVNGCAASRAFRQGWAEERRPSKRYWRHPVHLCCGGLVASWVIPQEITSTRSKEYKIGIQTCARPKAG